MAFTDGGDIVNKRQEIADSHRRFSSFTVQVENHSVFRTMESSSTSGSDEELLVTSSGFNFGVQREHLRTCCASCEEEEDKLAAVGLRTYYNM